MTFDKYFWVIHSHVYDRVINGQHGYMYLEAHPRERVNRIPVVPLKMCVYNDGTLCGRALLRADHENENRGPFSLSCAFCGLHTEAYDTVEELAEVWNREVIAKKVFIDL